MAYSYIKSEDIKVFPCANRGQKINTEGQVIQIYNVESRLNTEYNLTHLYGSNGGICCYVDKYELDTNNKLKPDSTLTVFIGGYYFEIEIKPEYLTTGAIFSHEAWLNIDLVETDLDTYNQTKILKNLEDSLITCLDSSTEDIYYFRGLGVSTSRVSTNEHYTLKLLNADGTFNNQSTRSIDPEKMVLEDLNFKNENDTIVTQYNGKNIISVKSGNGIVFTPDIDNKTLTISANADSIIETGDNVIKTVEDNKIILSATDTIPAIYITGITSSSSTNTLVYTNDSNIDIDTAGVSFWLVIPSTVGANIAKNRLNNKPMLVDGNLCSEITSGTFFVTFDGTNYNLNKQNLFMPKTGANLGQISHKLYGANSPSNSNSYPNIEFYICESSPSNDKIYLHGTVQSDTLSDRTNIGLGVVNLTTLNRKISSGTTDPTSTLNHQKGDIYIKYSTT